jgi:RIP metalloprotease RseP
MRRPAASDFRELIAAAVREDAALDSTAAAVQRPLSADDLKGARAALPTLRAALEQARLSPSARRSVRPITVMVERSGRTITLGPRRTIEQHGRWIWGFVPASELVSHPLGSSARLAIGDCWRVVTGTVASLGNVFDGHSGAQLTGPVGIVRTSSQVLKVGLNWYLELLGLISMSLALFNALPLLPLDGGNIVISVIEGLRGRAVPNSIYRRFSTIGIALILFVSVIGFSNDIGNVRQ